MTTAILAVQGAFAEHAAMLERLGEPCVLLRQAADLAQDFERLVLPGGESTTQAKFLFEQGMLEPLRQRIEAGMPTLATCAGLILLARELEGDDPPAHKRFATLPARVRRNAYGRQLGSFRAQLRLEEPTVDQADGGANDETAALHAQCLPSQPRGIPATFIRAPQIVSFKSDVHVLAKHENTPVAVRYHNQIACAFHPELDESTVIHEMFLNLTTH